MPMVRRFADSDIPRRRKYNRGNMSDALTVAASLAKDTGLLYYAYATAYGWLVTKLPPPIYQRYAIAEKSSGGVTLTMMND